MKGYNTRWLLIALMVAGLPLWGAEITSTSTNQSPKKPNPAWADKQGCTRNLHEIYAAIQAYQADHKDLPNWLSDLVPDYLPNVNVLICPLCRRTGKAEDPPLADPKLPSSYLYEFCPVPLGPLAPKAPKRTRRDWKRRQMGLLGSVVPIVRCRHHHPTLNLSFDGKVYESPPAWEDAFTNRIALESLTAAKLFQNESPPARPRFKGRNPQAAPGMLDLTRFYNVAFFESWLGKTNENLSTIPRDLQEFGGVGFDVRGLIQLAGKSTPEKKFPVQVKGLPVGLKCKRLYFLHAAGLGTPAETGKQVGSYFVHYAGNPARLEIPIIYGKDLANWRSESGEQDLPGGLKPAWIVPSNNAKSGKLPARGPRLFMTAWSNLLPDVQIESIDFVSNMSGAAPFLVAISAE